MVSKEHARAQYDALTIELDNHRCKAWPSIWQSLQRVYRACQRNVAELLAHIELPASDPRLVLELMSPDPTNAISEQYFDELFRLLQNYLSTVASLVDHSRNTMRRYKETTTATAYARRTLALAETGVAVFLKELRNYVAHHRVMSMSRALNFGFGGRSVSFDLSFSTAELLDTHEWNRTSEAYLRSMDRIDVDACVREYDQLVYGWLFGEASALREADLEAWNQLFAQRSDLVQYL